MLYRSFICNCRADNELLLLVVHGGSKMIVPRSEGGIVVWIPDCLFFLTLIRDCLEIKKKYLYCQEWDSNPCPFGPVPETGALDQLGHLDLRAR